MVHKDFADLKEEEQHQSTLIETKLNNFQLRFTTVNDVSLILSFIKELAAYEHLSNEVIATEAILQDSLFIRKAAEVIIGEYDGQPVSYALFFHNFSTFLGKPGIYLEDLYVKPEMRGKGMGKIMLAYLAKLVIERNCGRLEWWCLDWNESSVDFYQRMGADPMDEWTVFRVCDQALMDLAKRFDKL